MGCDSDVGNVSRGRRLKEGLKEVTRRIFLVVANGLENIRERKGKGGVAMKIRKELMEKGSEIVVREEGIMMGYVRQRRKKWRIVRVYVNGDIEQKLQKVEHWMEDKEQKVKTIIERDFNARTEDEDEGMVEEDEMGKKERRMKLKDGKLDRKGKILEFIEKREWGIYNGVVRGDEEVEYTFTEGRGYTVINYISDIGVKDRIKRLTIGDRIDSDHHPVEIWLKKEAKRKRSKAVSRKCWKGIWDKEGRINFKQKVGRLEIGEKELKKD